MPFKKVGSVDYYKYERKKSNAPALIFFGILVFAGIMGSQKKQSAPQPDSGPALTEPPAVDNPPDSDPHPETYRTANTASYRANKP